MKFWKIVTTLPPPRSQEPCKVDLLLHFDVEVLKCVWGMCTAVPLGLDGTGLESSLEGVRFRSRSGLGGCWSMVLSPAGTSSHGVRAVAGVLWHTRWGCVCTPGNGSSPELSNRTSLLVCVSLPGHVYDYNVPDCCTYTLLHGSV